MTGPFALGGGGRPRLASPPTLAAAVPFFLPALCPAGAAVYNVNEGRRERRQKVEMLGTYIMDLARHEDTRRRRSRCFLPPKYTVV